MYYILENILQTKQISITELGKQIGLDESALQRKMKQEIDFSLEEAKEIKDFIQYSGSIEDLFQTDAGL